MAIKRLQIERVYPFAIDYPFFHDIYVQLVYEGEPALFPPVLSVRPRHGRSRQEVRREKAEEEAGAEEEQKRRKKRKERVNVLATPCFKDCKRLLMPHRGWPVTRRSFSLSLFFSLSLLFWSSSPSTGLHLQLSPKYPFNKTEWHNHGRNRTDRIGRYGRLSDAFLN